MERTPRQIVQELELEQQIQAIRKRLFPCLASNIRDRRSNKNATFEIEEHDTKAVKSLKQVLDFLKKDIPLNDYRPQRIGSLEGSVNVADDSIRVGVTKFIHEAEYPVEMVHVVPRQIFPILDTITDGKPRALRLTELAKYGVSGLTDANFNHYPANEKGQLLETPIFLWLKQHIKAIDPNSQIALKQDKSIYTNYDYRVLSASIDGWISVDGQNRGCLEIKTTGASLLDAEFFKQSSNCLQLIEHHQYWIQIQAYLHIMSLDFCLLLIYSWQTEKYVCIHVSKDTGRFNNMYKRFVRKGFLPWVLDDLYRTENEEKYDITIRASYRLLQDLNKYICDGIDQKIAAYLNRRF